MYKSLSNREISDFPTNKPLGLFVLVLTLILLSVLNVYSFCQYKNRDNLYQLQPSVNIKINMIKKVNILLLNCNNKQKVCYNTSVLII